MITWLLLSALILVVAWLALETQRVHQAIDHFAQDLTAWQTRLAMMAPTARAEAWPPTEGDHDVL